MSKVLSPKFRVNFPNVFKARMNELSKKEEFSVLAIFPKGTDMTTMQNAAKAAIAEKWGADKAKWPKNLRLPFRSCDEKVEVTNGKKVYPPGYEEGGIFMNLKSTKRPGVVNSDVQEIIDESEFYSGCWARATLKAYAYDNAGNRGVSFGLQNIQKLEDGEPLGGRSRPEDDFAPVASATASTTDATDANSFFE